MLPDRWNPTEIGEIAKFSSGATPSKQNISFWGGIHPWITAKDLKQHYLENSIDTLTDIGLANAKTAPTGASLILVRGMTLLKDFPVGYATRPMSFNQDVKALVPLKGIDGLFLSFLLASQKEKIRQLVSTAGHGTGRLDTESIKSFPINLPPLEEQEKIAHILSTWDKAIATTEKLFANSRQQKKALMQQLLTRKLCFFEHNEKWSELELEKICSIDKGIQINKITLTHLGKYPVINGGVTPSGYTDDYNCEANTITISEGGNSCGFVGYMKQQFWCGGHCYSLNNVKVDNSYLFQFLKFNEPKIMRLRVGSGLPNIQKRAIGSVLIAIPPALEQQKIAQVLTTADHEIETLQQKLACLKQEKKALMQQLLTGKRRVKVDES
ncbi:MAG: restriction endonuclease subunit S [Methylococcaceae bacterium]|jgi:type I restriction enzyme S subunit